MNFDEWMKQTMPEGTAEDVVARAAWEVATLIEREECAQICDRFQKREMQPAECADAIRSRSA